MASHSSHHAGLPRLSDPGSMSYSGPSSYQHAPPPPPSQHQQHQHQHQHHHSQQHPHQHSHQPHQQHQHQQAPPPPPSSSSVNSSSHSSHHYYPSHGSQNISSHHGPGNPGIGVSDLYHPSPIGAPPPPSNSSIPSLPSMRTIDPLHPSSSSSLHSSPYPGPPSLPPGPLPFYSMPPPYGIQPHGLPSFSSYAHHHGHVNDLRVPSYNIGLRHKKEIKRRTKTGCMTCRKRRIKCDETHPTCNNCKKSKRDCAGYDPIFKQQPNNPAFLQATAHVSPHGSSGSATTTTTAPAPRPKSPPPVPYSAAASSSVASSSSANLADTKSPTVIGGLSSLSSTSSSSGSSGSGYYNVAGPQSSNGSSYQPNHSTNGNGSHHDINGNSNSNSHGSAPSYNQSTYSSRSIISPPEYPGTSFDPVHKEGPRRDYWTGRIHHGYPASTPDSRDSGRYNQGLL